MTRSRDVANIDTILTTKGDIYAASAAYTPARLAVGNNGETLVADSSTSTGLRYTSAIQQNPTINSAFDIWQRGTSFTGGSIAYTADRWCAGTNGATTTISRQVTGDTTNLPNIQYCLRMGRNSSSTSTTRIEICNNFETANSIPYAGKTVTLSFYARRGANFSGASNEMTFGIYTGTGTDQNLVQSYTGASFAISSAITLTTTWQRFTVTGTLSASLNELSLYFYYTPSGTAGAADYAEFTGVQLDIGSTALPYRKSAATLAGELAACQRYYIRMTNDGASDGLGPVGSAFNTGGITAQFNPPVKMRVTPTSVDWSNIRLYDGVTVHTVTAVTLGGCASGAVPQADFSATTLTQYRYYRVIANTGSSFIGFNAEL